MVNNMQVDNPLSNSDCLKFHLVESATVDDVPLQRGHLYWHEGCAGCLQRLNDTQTHENRITPRATYTD